MIQTFKELKEAFKRSEYFGEGAKRTECLHCGEDFFSCKGIKVFCKICIQKIKRGEIKE